MADGEIDNTTLLLLAAGAAGIYYLHQRRQQPRILYEYKVIQNPPDWNTREGLGEEATAVIEAFNANRRPPAFPGYTYSLQEQRAVNEAFNAYQRRLQK